MKTVFDQLVFGHMSTTTQKNSYKPSSITVSTVDNFEIHKEVKKMVLMDPTYEQAKFDADEELDIFTMVCPLTGEEHHIAYWSEVDNPNIIGGWLGFKEFAFYIYETKIRFYNTETSKGDIEVSRKDMKDSSRFFFDRRGTVYDNQAFPYRLNANLTLRRCIKTNLDFKEAVEDFLIHFYMEYMKAVHTAVFERLISRRFTSRPREDSVDELPF